MLLKYIINCVFIVNAICITDHTLVHIIGIKCLYKMQWIFFLVLTLLGRILFQDTWGWEPGRIGKW